MYRLLKNIKTKITLRGTALAMATMLTFATVVVQPAQAESVYNQLKCNAISAFADATMAAFRLSKAAMNAAFQLEINLLNAAWEVQDAAVAAIRQVSESAFLAQVAIFSIFVFNPAKRAALENYKQKILAAANKLHVKIDAIRATYREDMMALVKAHQKALIRLADIFETTVSKSLKVAQDNCTKVGVVINLWAEVTNANVQFVGDVLQQDVADVFKAGGLVFKRNGDFLSADLEFIGTANAALAALIRVLLTGQPEPTSSPKPVTAR